MNRLNNRLGLLNYLFYRIRKVHLADLNCRKLPACSRLNCTFFAIQGDIFTKGAAPLANHKSALKRARQNDIRRLRNKSTRTRVKNVVKDVRQAVAGQGGADAAAELNIAKAAIDKAAKKGVIHRNTAARKISRLTKQVNAARK